MYCRVASSNPICEISPSPFCSTYQSSLQKCPVSVMCKLILSPVGFPLQEVTHCGRDNLRMVVQYSAVHISSSIRSDGGLINCSHFYSLFDWESSSCQKYHSGNILWNMIEKYTARMILLGTTENPIHHLVK